MQQSVSIPFYECSWQRAQDEVQAQRPCDWWVHDWSAIDFYWLFGDQYWWVVPRPDYSPLARRYYDQISGELNSAISQAYASCENSRYPPQDSGPQGLSVRVSSRLSQGISAGHASAGNSAGNSGNGNGNGSGLQTRLTLALASASGSPAGSGAAPGSVRPPAPPAPVPLAQPCPNVLRELFSNPVDFDYFIYGHGSDNLRWSCQDQQAQVEDPYFEAYARTLRFSSETPVPFLGQLHLIMDNVADLWVRFESRVIPAAIADRVDPQQPLSYRVMLSNDYTKWSYFGVAAVVETLHIESGMMHTQSLHGPSYGMNQMGSNWWPTSWAQMDADGVFRHRNIDVFYWLSPQPPQELGLPTVGTYRVRYLLLGYRYYSGEHYVLSNATGLGEALMSGKPLWVDHHSTGFSAHIQGMDDGLIPSFEFTYKRSTVLAPGIEFDAVFDLKNITTFRFVVKVTNNHEFALGVVVQAALWQSWVRLEPGETKYLAGAISISGMSNWNAYPLHPEPIPPTYYGWTGNWGSAYVGMYNGEFRTYFQLFLTAPTQPETIPAAMPQRKASMLWQGDISYLTPQQQVRWGAIKKYTSEAHYDYDANLSQLNPYLGVEKLRAVEPSITKPSYQPLIDPTTYFVTGYQTSLSTAGSPWHKRPWPSYTGTGAMPIMVSVERYVYNGSYNVWATFDQVQISLTRTMFQQVAALLGVTDEVVMDGDDIRWFVPIGLSQSETYSNVLWIDHFYTRTGTMIDEAAMRGAFQSVIDSNAASWPGNRNIVIHPGVRFGMALDNGGYEAGDYLLGADGEMVEVSSLDDLATLSTRFLYVIRPEFR